MARGRAEAVRDLRRVWSVTAALGADRNVPSVGFSSVKRVPRKCLVAEPNPRSLSMSPFAPDFPDLEFETSQIVHVPFLTGWTAGPPRHFFLSFLRFSIVTNYCTCRLYLFVMTKATANIVKRCDDVPQKLRFSPNAGFAIRPSSPILMRWPWAGRLAGVRAYQPS